MIESHPTLDQLREALRRVDPTPFGAADLDPERRDAAVAVVLRAGEPLDILLIKRAASERDPWSGQMALPGGRWEQSDTGLLHTARRETYEETGLNLEVSGLPLGRLPDVVTKSAHLPKLRVAPFVFAVPESANASALSRAEVDSIHWVPLVHLSRPEVQSEIVVRREGFQKRFPSYHVVGQHVWGMTYGILSGLRALLDQP